jgi:hypothetical protein
MVRLLPKVVGVVAAVAAFGVDVAAVMLSGCELGSAGSPIGGAPNMCPPAAAVGVVVSLLSLLKLGYGEYSWVLCSSRNSGSSCEWSVYPLIFVKLFYSSNLDSCKKLRDEDEEAERAANFTKLKSSQEA